MSQPTLDQLKSRAYDLIAFRERTDRELQQVNQAIANHPDNSPDKASQDHKKKESK